MSKKYSPYFYLTFIAAIILSSCKHEPPDLPGAVKAPANADFLVEEQVGDRWFSGDTVEGLNRIRFTPLHAFDSLVWIIGDDTIHEKSVTKTNFPAGQLIPITLIVFRKADQVLYPFDDGADTLTRNIYIWPEELSDWKSEEKPTSSGPLNFWIPHVIHYYPIYGTYSGFRKSDPSTCIEVIIQDTFKMIRINIEVGQNREDYRRTCILSNLTYKGLMMDDYAGDNYFTDFSPKATYIHQLGKALAVGDHWPHPQWPPFIGYAWIDGPNHIAIDYQYQDSVSGKWVKDYFSGTKVY